LQIFVEIERARLTRKLAAMKEAEGQIAEAADILQEVAVVSSGWMSAAAGSCLSSVTDSVMTRASASMEVFASFMRRIAMAG
jgi:hypothetical protein